MMLDDTDDYAGRKKLYRSDDDVFLGVCGGIAERYDFNAWGVRLLFLALQFTFVPVMFIVYIVMGCVLKRSPESRRDRYWRARG